ncbi:hypothetical protein D4764_01G0021170 [Takifugu flavidus]|uniref:Uncharacterized protein n=1 Tax=Takifugu flavidus TaxID=433684 RepID=A0A5C6PR74_9TELE|nr:hypothetical protein D4764_01G0021170 [Takifugu flavidus]
MASRTPEQVPEPQEAPGAPGGPRRPQEPQEAPGAPGGPRSPRRPQVAPGGPRSPRRPQEAPGAPGGPRSPRRPQEAPDSLCEPLNTPEDISMTDVHVERPPAALENAAADPGPAAARRTPSVIVASISSPSILHSPPGYHGNLKLARTNSPVTREPLDVARLEIAVLP